MGGEGGGSAGKGVHSPDNTGPVKPAGEVSELRSEPDGTHS